MPKQGDSPSPVQHCREGHTAGFGVFFFCGGGVVGFSLSMQEFADGAKFNICRVPVASNLFVYLHSLRLCPSATKPLGK